MSDNEINLQDYQGGMFSGDDAGNDSAMELLKSMQAGSITGRDTANQSLTMEPLKAESLETTLKLLEYRQKDIRLLNKMPKLTAYNTVEEFLQLSSYGTNVGGFYNEGELSDAQDSTYIRRSSLIKYIQVTGEVTMQAQMVRSFVDAMRQEVENKTMWVQRRANIAITKGDSNVIPQEFDGLYKQHAAVGSGTGYLYSTLDQYFKSGTVIDLRGRSMKQADLENAAVQIDANYGNVSDLFAPTTVVSTLSQEFFASQRLLFNSGAPKAYEGSFGTVVKSIATTIGDVALNPDKFMKQDPAQFLTTSAATSYKAPNAPTPVAATLVSDANSAVQSGDTGTVYYAVSAVNRYGESQIVAVGGSLSLAVGYSVQLNFTAAGGPYAPTGYRIYRTLAGATSNAAAFYPIFNVSVSDVAAGFDGAAAGLVYDRVRFLPNTEQAFLTEMVDEVLSFKQLAPISKLDLAITSMSRRFITFLFATPQLYAGLKLIRFVNAGKTLTNP